MALMDHYFNEIVRVHDQVKESLDNQLQINRSQRARLRALRLLLSYEKQKNKDSYESAYESASSSADDGIFLRVRSDPSAVVVKKEPEEEPAMAPGKKRRVFNAPAICTSVCHVCAI